MIFEHEIPSGSRLYFGKSAKLKRQIEHTASQALYDLGFEEIVTPLFSYHQHDSFDDLKPLVRLNDEANNEVTLRADSTADVIRIVTKRLGRSTESKKWFYIQATVSFPTTEQYQIGAEIINGKLEQIAKVAASFLTSIDIKPLMQISNISIPHLLNEKYGISLEILKYVHLEQILLANLPWIKKLVKISSVSDLEDLSEFPDDIKEELRKIKYAASQIDYEDIVISPLFYAKMRYYDSLTFRMFEGDSLLAMGGIYTIENIEAAGFAIYTDECVNNKVTKVKNG